MNVLVCVKQVPDTTEIRIDPVTNTLIRSGVPSIVNPFDGYALEAAARIKDRDPDAKIVVLSMGPEQAKAALKECLSIAADKAYLVSDRAFGGSDTLATSYILSETIRKVEELEGRFDAIFCGKQAIDGDTAQVGPQIAEKLHLPQVTYAADIQKDGNTITVKRMLEDGYMTIKVKTPCLITCIKELNEPRYMSVGGVFEAYSKSMTTYDYEALKDDPLIDATTIGLKGSPTNIFKSFTPPQKGAGMMLEGADKATCEKLADILAKKHII